MANYIVAVTGASGSLYAKRLLEELAAQEHDIYLTVTRTGMEVMKGELGWQVPVGEEAAGEFFRRMLKYAPGKKSLQYFDYMDMGALIASGSIKTDGMIVIPCTMGTASGIANGASSNLVERAADVMLKEGRPLIVVPRETPLNQVHLKNLLSLAQMGVRIVPAMPAFYHNPRSVEDLVNFVVGRVMDLLGLEHNLYIPWQG